MNHVPKNKNMRGFTIIELSLAMTFVSVLLLAIAMTIVQIATIYNKGITLKEVNQTGRSISDSVTRSFEGSNGIMLSTNFITNVDGGRLCLGQYSYIWNYAKALEDNAPGVTRYLGGHPESVQLVKVPDPSATYCAMNGGAYAQQHILAADFAKSVELLKAGDRLLNIYRMAIASAPNGVDTLTGQQLYNVSFTIGTGLTSALAPSMTTCLPPGQLGANFTYCAVQQFDLVIRAGNRVN